RTPPPAAPPDTRRTRPPARRRPPPTRRESDRAGASGDLACGGPDIGIRGRPARNHGRRRAREELEASPCSGRRIMPDSPRSGYEVRTSGTRSVWRIASERCDLAAGLPAHGLTEPFFEKPAVAAAFELQKRGPRPPRRM